MTGAGHADFTKPNVPQYALVERMREIANRHKRSVGEVAIAWTLRHPVVTGAIVGARNTRQADGVVRARELHPNEIEAFAETAA
jgi:aryl-alcohol dehydrogenase-like predicted oxidoreductase